MGRTPCCDKETVKKGTWSAEEDAALKSYIDSHGVITNWIALPPKIGLNRCGKSCRLRWLNYLRPNIKHGKFTEEEDKIISEIYLSIGSRWAMMADKLPGRTDNDIKNYWNTKLKKKIVGNHKKAHKRPSFRGFNGGIGVDDNPPAFTITNGHLMSTSWPSNTDLCNQQESDGCTTDGGLMGAYLENHAPMILSFPTSNTTTSTTSSNGEGGSSTSSAIPDPPMKNIIKDRQSTACQYCFRENGSSSSSYDLMNTSHKMPDICTNMYLDMNIDIEVVDGGSTSTPLEAPSTSLKELQDLLFNDSSTPNNLTTTPFQANSICGSDYFFQHHFENLESWNDDAIITSLISSLPMEDDNIVNLQTNPCEYGDSILPQLF